MNYPFFQRLCLFMVLSLLATCSKNNTPAICNNGQSIGLADENCLVFADQGQLQAYRIQIEDIIRETVRQVHERIPETHRIGIQVKAGSATVIPEIGIGGRAYTDEVFLTVNPNFPDLENSLATELFPLLAHELHHVLRHRALDFSPHLLGIFVNEGLADHFSIEMAGVDPPPWSVALHGEELDFWIAEAREVWLDPADDLDAWLFGTTPDIPRWAGYAIGFELVRRYLAAHPDQQPSDLIHEPFLSFLPG